MSLRNANLNRTWSRGFHPAATATCGLRPSPVWGKGTHWSHLREGPWQSQTHITVTPGLWVRTGASPEPGQTQLPSLLTPCSPARPNLISPSLMQFRVDRLFGPAWELTTILTVSRNVKYKPLPICEMHLGDLCKQLFSFCT